MYKCIAEKTVAHVIGETAWGGADSVQCQQRRPPRTCPQTDILGSSHLHLEESRLICFFFELESNH